MLLRNGLPGRLNQNIIYGKGLKILLPVIDPVLILGLGGSDGTGTQVCKQFQFIQSLVDLSQHFLYICIIVQVKAYLCHALVRRKLRKDVDEHSLCLFFRQRDIILNLNALNANIVKHTADQIYGLGGGC